ncbi:MAG: hypothetical protein N4R38_04690 [Lactobacillus crispatus]|nr:hypothetical protein [Lactobacillus crispatus]
MRKLSTSILEKIVGGRSKIRRHFFKSNSRGWGKWFWWRNILNENAEYDLNGAKFDDFSCEIMCVVTLIV